MALRLLAWISDLRLAIGLLLMIAVGSSIGTLIPQQEAVDRYHQLYDNHPWLGLLDGDWILRLELDHVYASNWFLALLAWLGLSLVLCSWRRQWPALKAALRWIDYRTPRQLSKLSLAETISSPDPGSDLSSLEQLLTAQGWQLQRGQDRLAARRGLAGRVGPLLVHAGMVVLMVGSAWGALGGQRLERFLAPGRELSLLDSRGVSQLNLAVESFRIERDPAGRPEQFRSSLLLRNGDQEPLQTAEVSVNHPLRFRGMTVYQADWALAAITVQIGRSPLLELPLRSLPELGEQIWGLALPTRPDGSEPVLLTLGNEQGPVEIFASDAQRIGQIVPGGEPIEIGGLPLRVVSVLPASGLLLKRDPGVPLVYAGFAIALVGGGLSLIATRQLWAIAEPERGRLHLAGLCNRNLTALAQELPELLATVERSRSPASQLAQQA
ncbi:cytochrome c biogenesis protein ResB [Synechococcus sp. CS-1324]|uniref:cytochrome c biogenesis protein ResB n=1 Tax=Synechococcus sp. CS-1324 TaxID=2847980 RepID=UPI000DB65001|nr:cytochrome c biogenesis protein ResB [Synechococcus sp. CS-1324]MCT0230577.1 cytochrome c biogenesis protein ResB [Synechococcus sp. CS-1324]PZV05698.1 MAG: cytochrome C biogenesis protein CcsB [Cyanobium sp.]